MLSEIDWNQFMAEMGITSNPSEASSTPKRQLLEESTFKEQERKYKQAKRDLDKSTLKNKSVSKGKDLNLLRDNYIKPKLKVKSEIPKKLNLKQPRLKQKLVKTVQKNIQELPLYNTEASYSESIKNKPPVQLTCEYKKPLDFEIVTCMKTKPALNSRITPPLWLSSVLIKNPLEVKQHILNSLDWALFNLTEERELKFVITLV